MKNKQLAIVSLCVAAILLAACSTPTPPPTPEEPTPTPYGDALPRVEVVASSETAFKASAAIDGSLNSRWGSEQGVPQWIYVDLGDTYHITRVIIRWFVMVSGTQYPGYAVAYEIQVSDDAENWTTVASIVDGDGQIDDFTGLSATGRYVRMYGTEQAEQGNFAIGEFEVYGESVTE